MPLTKQKTHLAMISRAFIAGCVFGLFSLFYKRFIFSGYCLRYGIS